MAADAGMVLDAAKAAGARRIVTVIGTTGAELVEAWLDGGEMAQDPLNGTGHAVLAAQRTLNDFTGIVLVMFADTPLVTAATLIDLSAAIRDGADIAVLGFTAADPTGYGRLITDADGRLIKIVEENDTDTTERDIVLVNGGVMAARAELLFELAKATPDNSKGEIYLTNIVERASHSNLKWFTTLPVKVRLLASMTVTTSFSLRRLSRNGYAPKPCSSHDGPRDRILSADATLGAT